MMTFSKSYSPMHKSSLAIHEIKLMIQPCPCLSNIGGIGEHANSTLHLGKISTRHHCRRLVVDPNLEPCGTPVYKLDGALRLDCGYGGIDILWDHITSVEKTAGHVLA